MINKTTSNQAAHYRPRGASRPVDELRDEIGPRGRPHGIEDAVKIDLSSEEFRLAQEGIQNTNLPQSSVRVVEHSSLLLRFLRENTPGTGGSLEDSMRNLASAFEALRDEIGDDSDERMAALKDAFRNIAQMFFALDARTQARDEWLAKNPSDGTPMSREQIDFVHQRILEARERSNIFADVFFAHFHQHGTQGAFEIAWAAVHGEYSEEYANELESIIAEHMASSKQAEETANGPNPTLIAMRIARRIANGDNVPMQDHRFLAEYDSRLYNMAMNKRIIAENDDPYNYDSLVDELEGGSDSPVANTGSGDAETVLAESVDVYY